MTFFKIKNLLLYFTLIKLIILYYKNMITNFNTILYIFYFLSYYYFSFYFYDIS